MKTAVRQRHTLVYDDASMKWVIEDCIRYIEGGGQNAFIDVDRSVYVQLQTALAGRGYATRFMYPHRNGLSARVTVSIRDSP